jgi:hypothetical protein
MRFAREERKEEEEYRERHLNELALERKYVKITIAGQQQCKNVRRSS